MKKASSALKAAAGYVSAAMFAIYVVSTVYFWYCMYGPLGVVGSLVTFPFSVLGAFVLPLFSESFGGFAIDAAWVGSAFLLAFLASRE